MFVGASAPRAERDVSKRMRCMERNVRCMKRNVLFTLLRPRRHYQIVSELLAGMFTEVSAPIVSELLAGMLTGVSDPHAGIAAGASAPPAGTNCCWGFGSTGGDAQKQKKILRYISLRCRRIIISIPSSATQRNTTHPNPTQHNTTQRNTTQHNTTQPGAGHACPALPR
mgnify:CR=1 FL=1